MRCLVIAYAFPPIGNAEAFVGGKAILGLAKQGAQITVATIDPFSIGITIDHAFDSQIEKHIDKILRADLSVVEKKILGICPRIANLLLQYPDKFILFNKYVKGLLDSIDLTAFDIIISRSQWHSAHLVALSIKKIYPKLPWIAQFSDPWVDNPYNLPVPLGKYFAVKWEDEIIKYADLITYTSKETISLVSKRYADEYQNKMAYIPHCFDKSLYKRSERDDFNEYIIRCLGAFYGPRSPEPFFEAIENIASKKPELLDNVLIEFYGLSKRKAKLINMYPLAKRIIKFNRNINYIESLNKMLEANCLLSIDAPLNNSPFFPSKLVDYMGSGNFIFSVSPSGCATNIIDDVNGFTANVNDIEDIIAKLEKLLILRPSKLDNSKFNIYDQQYVSREFYNTIERIINSNV